jgi:hypothetical protein
MFDKISSFFQKHGILTAMLTSILSLAGTGYSVFQTSNFQERQVAIEQISKFDAANSPLVDAAGAFIAAVNASKDVSDARLKIRTVVAGQVQDIQTLRKTFDRDVLRLVDEYQQALLEFVRIADRTSTVTEMRPWAESFGRVLDTRTALSNGMATSLGVGSVKPRA